MKMFIDDINIEPTIIADPVLTSISYKVEKMGVPGKLGDHKVVVTIDTMANTQKQEFTVKIENSDAIDASKRLDAIKAAAALFDAENINLSDVRNLFIKTEETIEGGGEDLEEGEENH